MLDFLTFVGLGVDVLQNSMKCFCSDDSSTSCVLLVIKQVPEFQKIHEVKAI